MKQEREQEAKPFSGLFEESYFSVGYGLVLPANSFANRSSQFVKGSAALLAQNGQVYQMVPAKQCPSAGSQILPKSLYFIEPFVA